MGCRICKIAVGLVILIALTAVISAIISSGGGALPVWFGFVKGVAGILGVEGAKAISILGYRLFASILVIGAALVFILADVIDWILCEICRALGQCSDCPSPKLNP